ncbi:DNA binding protein [Bacillus phage 000TH008]|nr:DNA binding protein [Bacillus phage 000TH008]
MRLSKRTDNNKFVCPHCGHEYDDWWEYVDPVDMEADFEEECRECGEIFHVFMDTTITFVTLTSKNLLDDLDEVKYDASFNSFWLGANGNEYIAYKGSQHIFVYPSNEYPDPPSSVIMFDRRIETVDDFKEALKHGEVLAAHYT